LQHRFARIPILNGRSTIGSVFDLAEIVGVECVIAVTGRANARPRTGFAEPFMAWHEARWIASSQGLLAMTGETAAHEALT